MPWPQNPRILGKRHPRVDGKAKASGRAKYGSDQNPKGLLFGAILHAPVAAGRLTKLDISPAKQVPGVKAVMKFPGIDVGSNIPYEGLPLVAVAATSPSVAEDALRAIVLEIQPAEPLVDHEKAMREGKHGQPNETGATQEEVDAALAKSDVKIEATYVTSVRTHCCMEPHGLTAQWQGEKLVAWCSTQSISGVQGHLRRSTNASDVQVLCDYMGGGFGSKFDADSWGVIAAQLAKEAGAPVKMFLSRAAEHHIAGVSPGGTQKFRAGANKDGKLTVVERVHYGDGFSLSAGPTYVYMPPAVTRNVFFPINLTAGKGRAFRAPSHPHMCFGTDQMMDELAHALGMDPLEFRIKNLNPDSSDPTRAMIDRTRIAQLRHGAELIGWSRRNNPPGAGKGPIKRGIGVACHTWGGGPHGNNTEVRIFSDGRVEVRTATQDIGTGTRSNIALVAAEELGLTPEQITVLIGNTDYPPDGGSGGSTTVGAVTSGAKTATEKAKQALFAKVAADLGATAADLEIGEGGKIFVRGNPSKSLTWQQACAKIGAEPIVGRRTQGETQPGLTSSGVAGVHFAEVEVDVETGKVRVVKFVAIQDQGFVINRLTCESQIRGGAIMGISWALGEQRILDPESGIMLNPDILNYRIAGPMEMPEIVPVVWDPPEVRARGVIGNGEPPVISPAGAIANAIYNAIGVRVRELPFTPDRILNALARKEA